MPPIPTSGMSGPTGPCRVPCCCTREVPHAGVTACPPRLAGLTHRPEDPRFQRVENVSSTRSSESIRPVVQHCAAGLTIPAMTRRLTAALVVVLLLAGCASGAPSAGRGSAADVHTHHRVYLQEMRRVLPGHSDARLDKLGESLCAAFRAGATWPDAVRHLIDDGLTASQAGAVIGSAVWQFCPTFQRVIPH